MSFADFFYRTLELGEDSILQNYRYVFFQGFEWHNSVSSQRVDNLDLLTSPIELITHQPRSVIKSLKVIKNEVKNIINTFLNFKLVRSFIKGSSYEKKQ